MRWRSIGASTTSPEVMCGSILVMVLRMVNVWMGKVVCLDTPNASI